MISAIICTYNPRMDYLTRVLDALKGQELPKSEWELLVIDNGSAEPLTGRLDLSWHPQGKIIREDTLGVANARTRGINSCIGTLIVFIDDDNVLDRGYLSNCAKIAIDWPQLGVWGGSIAPEFEIEPPAHLRPYLKALALREVKQLLWSNVRTCAEAEPWGAGLCVRKSAALAYCEHFKTTKIRILDRTGDLLLSGGDTEMCFVVCSLGLGMAIFPNLKLLHLIAKRRLNDDYMLRILSGLTATHLLLSHKWHDATYNSPYSPVEILRCLKQMMSLQPFKIRLAVAKYRGRVTAAKIISRYSDSQSSS